MGYSNRNDYVNCVLPACYDFIQFLIFFVTLYKGQLHKASAFASRTCYDVL